MPLSGQPIAERVLAQMTAPQGGVSVARPISGQALINAYYQGQENRRAEQEARSLADLRNAQIQESQQRAAQVRQQQERRRVMDLREDQVGFIESATRNLMPALEVYQQDPFTANRIYQEQLQNITTAYPEYSSRLPQRITQDNYSVLLGMADSGIRDLETRRTMLLEQQKMAGRPSPREKAGMEAATKERAKSLQKRADTVQEQGVAAANSINNLTMARNILDQGLETGAFQPMISGINKYLSDAGISIPGLNEVSSVESFNTLMAREVITELEQMDRPSDADARLIEKKMANIRNDEKAARFIVDSTLAVKQRQLEKSEFYEEFWVRNKAYETETTSVDKAWAEYVNKTPLVGSRKSDGLTRTWPEFKKAYKKAKPTATMDQIINDWNAVYGE